MASKSQRKTVGGLTQPEYGLLRALTDQQPLDSARLEAEVLGVVSDRMALADAMIEAAKMLVRSEHPLVRRSAASRAYFGAYQVARATVFAVSRRDEDDHEKLPAIVDKLPEQREAVGHVLKELRRLRNEMDYSPYPGPDRETQYEAGEIDGEINRSIERAEGIVAALRQYLEQRAVRQ